MHPYRLVTWLDWLVVAGLLVLALSGAKWIVDTTLTAEQRVVEAVAAVPSDPCPPPAAEECWCAYAKGDKVYVRAMTPPVHMPPATAAVPAPAPGAASTGAAHGH